MKRNFNHGLLLGIVLLFAACSTEELVFPEVVNQNTESGVIDVIVKPSDVKVEGNYDQLFSIKWPKFSDKISKVILSYEDNGQTITKEVSDFSEDYVVETEEIKEYTFSFISVSKDGRETSPVAVKATNKGLYIAELLERSSLEFEGRFVTVSVPNPLESLLKIKVSHANATGVHEEIITSSEDRISYKFNGTSGSSFTFSIEDGKGNKVEKIEDYVLTPKLYSSANDKIFWTPWAPNGYPAGFSAERAIDGTIGTGYEFVSGSSANPFIYQISFTKTRVKSDPNYNNVALKTPSGDHELILIKSITVYSGAVAWGINPSIARVFGIKPDGQEVNLGTHSNATTVNTSNPFIIDLSSNNDYLKGVRLEFLNSLTNPTATGVNINEINISGYPED